MIIHKAGKQKTNRYIGFGQYENITAPLCVGARGLYAGKSYYISTRWLNVTCKHCIKRNSNA